MGAFFTGLSALTHPAALSAIALLLLNDHVFKHYFPSVLTGKISDFAGLLFFPLLLSALIGMLEKRPRRAAVWGFALTGLVFAALKLHPPAASWASAALSRLLDANVWITPDPTDLSALLMLLPAWRLWESAPKRQYDRRLGYAALAVGTLASVATSPCPPPMLITRLAQTESVMYAWGSGSIFRSDDGGLTWTISNVVPEPQQTELQTTAPLPKTVCEEANPLRCYRVGVKELAVEFSGDGGKTWRLDWHIPAGRLAFMNRARSGILSCEREVIGGPFDLLIDSNDSVVVAMGNEGVLVGGAGAWQRIAVGRTSGPTPYRESNVLVALGVVIWEVLAGVLVAYFYWIGLTFWAGRQATAGKRGGWLFTLWWGLLFAFLFVVYLFLDASLMNQVEPLPIFGVFGLGVLLIPPFTWWLASRKVAQPKAFRQAGAGAFGQSLLLFLALAVPFIAWALGFPPFYWMAVGIALPFSIWIGRQGIIRVTGGVQKSLLPRSVTEPGGLEDEFGTGLKDG